jgi:hypothetical protein
MLDGSAAITEMSGLHSFDFCIFIIVKYLFFYMELNYFIVSEGAKRDDKHEKVE